MQTRKKITVMDWGVNFLLLQICIHQETYTQYYWLAISVVILNMFTI